MDIMIDWAAAEGWNPGLNDAQCFYQADPQGFFIGKIEGEPIGSIGAVSYGDSFGFIGLYIVVPAYRGMGYGIPLWEMAMEYLGYRNIGLDGVIAQQENYKKSGFQFAYRNIRYQGRMKGIPSKTLLPVKELSFQQILQYDRRFFPASRDTFLSCWLEQPNSLSLAKVEKGLITGYGTIRACRRGFKIGPLFADDAAVAEELLLALVTRADGDQIYFDVPERNPAAVSLAEKYGMKMIFETARMYTSEEPNIELSKVFGITTYELG